MTTKTNTQAKHLEKTTSNKTLILLYCLFAFWLQQLLRLNRQQNLFYTEFIVSTATGIRFSERKDLEKSCVFSAIWHENAWVHELVFATARTKSPPALRPKLFNGLKSSFKLRL